MSTAECPDDDLSTEELEQLELEQREQERRYVNVTRALSVSLIFVLPLILTYEFGALLLGADINAAAVWVKRPISWLHENPVQIFGADAMLFINAAAIVIVLGAAWHVRSLGALHPWTFIGMLGESCLYAALIGPLALAPLIGKLQFGALDPHTENLFGSFIIASGAGFYEELFFRLIILNAVYFLAKELGELKPFTAGAAALVVSGAIFSAVHFLSPGEAVDLGAFIYRLVAGMILGIIFLTRGFGIAAWTHTLYDIYVLCFAAR